MLQFSFVYGETSVVEEGHSWNTTATEYCGVSCCWVVGALAHAAARAGPLSLDLRLAHFLYVLPHFCGLHFEKQGKQLGSS